MVTIDCDFVNSDNEWVIMYFWGDWIFGTIFSVYCNVSMVDGILAYCLK